MSFSFFACNATADHTFRVEGDSTGTAKIAPRNILHQAAIVLRSQGAFAHAAGRSNRDRRSQRISGPSDDALAWWRAYRNRSSSATLPATRSAHQRRYHLVVTASGSSLSRQGDRRYPESPGTQDSDRRTLHRQSGRQSATLSRYPAFPATGSASRRRCRPYPQGRADLRHEHLHHPSLVGRRLHRPENK